jgi:5-formyltetrahydrofolate cyclo-ligase
VRSLPAETRAAAALRVCERIRGTIEWQQAATVLLYAALPDEIDLSPLVLEALAEGKQVALPQFDPLARTYRASEVRAGLSELAIGQYGIREPGPEARVVPWKQLDFALVPGLAFAPNGCRLGRGRGFYDRLLANLRGLKCGVGFDQQLIAQIPVEPHDILLDCIVTPSGWLDRTQRQKGKDRVG